MPLYEFRCANCGDDFEELVPMGTSSIPCPACGGGKVSRKVSACGFSVSGGTTSASSSSDCSGCLSSACSGCGSRPSH
ncbi:MAG: zinc ribbon domain-containing protein [Deltaproteobacteria bacterium]|nr:zinc ribbon domain-containing protein [Deltaproteobacteria bacterium]